MNKLIIIPQFKRMHLFIILCIGIIVLGYIGIAQAATPGDLDTTFGIGGVQYTDLSAAGDTAYGVVIQSDNKSVVVGESNGDFGVVRYTDAGALDTTFSTDGKVTTAVTANIDVAQAVAIDDNGKIVVAGYSEDALGTPAAFVVARYSSSGVLDGTFGSSGIFTHTLGGAAAEGTSLAIQADGKIIVAGTVDEDFAVARLTTSGALDTSFGTGSSGYVVTNLAPLNRPDDARAVVIQPSGKIVLGGFSDLGDHEDFTIARFTTAGVLDTTFGTGGKAFADPSGSRNDRAYGLGVQSDGGLVLAGYAETAVVINKEDYALARFTVDGVLDNSFGTSGTVVTANEGTDWAYAVAVQPTDKVVVAGFSSGVNAEDFHLIRYNTNGTLDTSFGTGGIVTTDIGTVVGGGNTGSQDQGYAIDIRGDKIVVVGQTDVPLSLGRMNFAVARYESQNNPPTLTSFSKSGIEGDDITFTSANFTDNFSDTDGDSMIRVKITSLPANGTLKLSSTTVSVDDVILTADLANLTFTPDIDWFGSTSFGWNGQDGLNYAVANASVNITVSDINDAPSFTFKVSPNQSVAEDAGAQSVTGLVATFSAGTNEGSQTVDFLVSNDNNPLFSVQPTIDGTGKLTYTPAANRFGTATVTVWAHDNGGTDNAGDVDTSAAQTFDIVINAVNDAPTFTNAGNVSVNEDAGATTISAWATNISEGPFETQTIAFDINTDSPSLLLSLGLDEINGDLTFTPATDLFGTAVVTVTLSDNGGGNDTSAQVIFDVTINSVNDLPSFTMMGSPNQSKLEDSGTTVVSNFITASSPGPANESGQTVTYAITTTNDALFAAGPTINASNGLSYTLADDANGSATVWVRAHDNGGVANGGVDTSAAQTFLVDVTAVNDPPSLTAGANPSVNEDSGAQTLVAWATNISAGPADESGQNVSVKSISNDNNGLFSSSPLLNTNNGQLTFTPAADANGSATVTFTIEDNGGVLNGGNDTSVEYSFVITVNPVNDVPSFTKGADETVLEDAGAQSVAGWATGLSAGPPNESSQTLHFNVSTDNDSLFSMLPAIAANGDLTYTPAADANGSATVTVTIQDNGLTTNGGVDTSASQTFVIEVTAVNDPPSLTTGTAPTVDEDSGAQTINNWATSISTGPSDESGQSVVSSSMSNDDNTLFSVQPALNMGTNQLTFTPAADVNGSATVTFTVTDDGGTLNGGNDTSVEYTFDITVNPVNDVPSFTKGADETVLEDAGAQSATGWATSMSAGPSNENAQTWQFNVSTDNDALFSALPAIASNGDLTYTPAANANGSATVTVAMQDNGGGDDTSASQMFVINVTAVNDEPTFTNGGDVFVDEEFATDPTTVSSWATNIDAGASDESGQVLIFTVTTDNDSIFTVLPSIDPISGDLTFTTVGGSGDSALVSVTLSDDGGTANGGIDTSALATFTVAVAFVNDAPTFIAGGNESVDEDAGAQTVIGWASDMDAGSPTESAQVLTFNTSNDNTALFAAQPAIDVTSGDLTYTPASNMHGTATITVTLSDDGGTANNGSDTSAVQTFVITVNSVNDLPTIASYDVSGKPNQVITFTVAGFEAVFADIDGDSLVMVQITALSADGELAVNGTAVILDQEIPVADLDALTFMPNPSWNGETSFDWNGSDGADYAATSASVNITIERLMVYLPVIMK